ncbi:helix-turn-helix transcriptional regulator [Frankia sp. Ag45/Mut15]|uniref:Helix-turn-helix transcriptional regulator n=1 Tax=Frankia umida TaxID=573489 RepID=A0ABT0K4F8_9ACTN|nr:helix-turn-helix transcriptional regulator [Frankia umida]MCK9878689.1 helix-turn-helix transcriptional regulator [Frankia umida]
MLETMDRAELAAMLRTWRARLTPDEVGLPQGPRRRTPGLRREEVALLAGISPDYLVRLEQGRGPHPSGSVLTALGRALRLDEDERDHLFDLAGAHPPRAGRIDGTVRPSVPRLIDRLSDPAILCDAKGGTIAWNPLAVALLGDFTTWPSGHRNVAWWRFTGPPGRLVRTPEEEDVWADEIVADLRVAAARYPGDAGVRSLIADLRRISPDFEWRWQQRGATQRRSARKRIAHPAVGLVEVDCDVLHLPEADQRLVVYTAEPGSPAAAPLDLLRVLDSQNAPQPAGSGG